jgi:hypothetical protein
MVYATIAKPTITSELSLAKLTFEGMSDELVNLGKPTPITTFAPKHIVIDVQTSVRQAEVTIPAWVIERQQKRAAINSRVHVFSDFSRAPRSNRALV